MSVKSECQEFQARLRRGELSTPGGAKPLGGFNRSAHSAGPSRDSRSELSILSLVF